MAITWQRTRVLIAALAATAALAGCGDDSSGGASSGGTATLKVGVIPIADVAPLYVGIEQGFFKAESLKIEPKLAEGGAAIVPAVVAGDDDIGFSNTTSLIIAVSKQLPVQIVSQGVLAGTGDDDAWDGLMIPEGSPIKTAKDLEGKTIAVNNINNVGSLAINTAMAKAGADYKRVKYLEIPFPEMNAALDKKRVDAIWQVEPGYTGALAAGARPLFHPYEETAPNLTVAGYFASKEFIAKNKDVLARFQRAIRKSLEYSAQHPDAVRKAVATYTDIPPGVIAKIKLPVFKPDLNEPTIQTTIDLAAKYGYIETKPSLGDLIAK
jgi:NitT/TauT family transport system substrate-binding protein